VTITVALLTVAGTIGGGVWLAKRQREKSALFNASNKFKSLLIRDLPNFESSETTFSACILSHYPEHNAELKQLFNFLPDSKRTEIGDAWMSYTHLYEEVNALGIFGVVSAELPHPDFESSPENLDGIERKKKLRVVNVFKNIQKIL
jgi:hypothetical protein